MMLFEIATLWLRQSSRWRMYGCGGLLAMTHHIVIAKARKRLWQSAISPICMRSPRLTHVSLAMT